MADIEKHNPTDLVAPELLKDLRQIIDAARSHVAATANYELTAMYWNIGNRINNEVLKNECAEYGKQIVSPLVSKLCQRVDTIVAPEARQLLSPHYLTITPLV